VVDFVGFSSFSNSTAVVVFDDIFERFGDTNGLIGVRNICLSWVIHDSNSPGFDIS
jgi:hypothetical protein